jgi:uncharacterized membrane protein YgcG
VHSDTHRYRAASGTCFTTALCIKGWYLQQQHHSQQQQRLRWLRLRLRRHQQQQRRLRRHQQLGSGGGSSSSGGGITARGAGCTLSTYSWLTLRHFSFTCLALATSC